MTWRQDGINIVAAVCEQRSDLCFRGDLQSDFPLQRGSSPDKWPTLKAAYHGGDSGPYSKSYAIQGFAENLIQDVDELLRGKMPEIVVVAGQGVFCDLSGQVIKHLFSVPGLRMAPPSLMKRKNRAVVPTIGLVILTVTFHDDGTFSVVSNCYPLKGIENDYREKYSDAGGKLKRLSKDERKALELLDKTPRSLGELARAINKSDKTVGTILANLGNAGYVIDGPDEATKSYKLLHVAKSEPARNLTIDFASYFHEMITYGDVSDTHVGHKSELLPILNEAYDVFDKRGIKIVKHCGDLSNGLPKHEEHMKGEVYEFRATALKNIVRDKYPHREGIVTDMIGGDHDRWFLDKVGYDLIDGVADVRKDIVHLGMQQGDRLEGRLITMQCHYNWGTGYARSYKGQQAIEQWLLKEIEKDAARYKGKVLSVLSGGGHVYCAMLYKGIVFILLPCLQGKTGFISGLGKLSDVGFLIHSVTYSKEGVMTRFSVEFFNRGAEALALVRKQKESAANGSGKKNGNGQKKDAKK